LSTFRRLEAQEGLFKVYSSSASSFSAIQNDRLSQRLLLTGMWSAGVSHRNADNLPTSPPRFELERVGLLPAPASLPVAALSRWEVFLPALPEEARGVFHGGLVALFFAFSFGFRSSASCVAAVMICSSWRPLLGPVVEISQTRFPERAGELAPKGI
jgi:hypothetical protein